MASSSSTKMNPSWMENLPPDLCCQPLKNIAIPGTHNTFTYSLKADSPVSPGTPDTIRNLVTVFGKPASKVILKWSITQSLTIKEQLEYGIRYFDLRVATCKKHPGLYFIHGLYGCSVESGLAEIAEWLDAHPKEVVFLDFNHLYDMQPQDHQKLFEILKETFGNKLCPIIDTEETALNVLWENGWNVLVFYHNSYRQREDINTLWPGSHIPAPWPNTPEPTKMVNLLEANHTRGRNVKTFHVTQGILTPSGTTILQHIARPLKAVFAVPAMKNLKFYLKDKKAGATGVNIVTADFVETDNFVECVLALNSAK
ncbi:PI-PLC X domain-containing protein 3-like [Anneissia japonica]|uniref:PI-PLC X domain-containing protein 3-like n=1 Tax=Anneissia japonica TaxID=1529436 RepID=UPI0014254D47|nr:PI-PLC X domain-containing protein 3-like [Anneissia japonica]